MRKYAELNKVGIFRKLRHEGFLVKHYAGGYPYLDGHTILRSSILNPIYSYGNNYKKHGEDFSLFMWSTESDIAKVSKHFDKVVKSITKEEIKKFSNSSDKFVYVDADYEGDKK